MDKLQCTCSLTAWKFVLQQKPFYCLSSVITHLNVHPTKLPISVAPVAKEIAHVLVVPLPTLMPLAVSLQSPFKDTNWPEDPTSPEWRQNYIYWTLDQIQIKQQFIKKPPTFPSSLDFCYLEDSPQV